LGKRPVKSGVPQKWEKAAIVLPGAETLGGTHIAPGKQCSSPNGTRHQLVGKEDDDRTLRRWSCAGRLVVHRNTPLTTCLKGSTNDAKHYSY
jgi:hypothetical protein